MKLQVKLGLYIMLVAFIPYALGVSFLFFSVEKRMENTNIVLAEKYNGGIASGLSGYLDKLRITSEVLAKFPAVKEKDWLGIKDGLIKIHESNRDITGFVVGNKDGTYWYSHVDGNKYQGGLVTVDDSDPLAKPRTLTNTPYFAEMVSNNKDNKVVSMPQSQTNANAIKMVISQPTSFEQSDEICSFLKERKSIIVNLEYVNKDVARRIVDFISGGVYALDGYIQKVSNSIFLVAPSNYEITNEMAREEMKNKLSVSWLKNNGIN